MNGRNHKSEYFVCVCVCGSRLTKMIRGVDTLSSHLEDCVNYYLERFTRDPFKGQKIE